jgi:hypothetical protein
MVFQNLQSQDDEEADATTEAGKTPRRCFIRNRISL